MKVPVFGIGKRAREVLDRNDDLFVVALIILVGFAGFGLGRLSVEESSVESVQIEYFGGAQAVSATAAEGVRDAVVPMRQGEVVASKNSTKYHYPWCSGAQRIKDENKIWFTTVASAKDAGYEPAANCKGLE